jgi:hypothetical protein
MFSKTSLSLSCILAVKAFFTASDKNRMNEFIDQTFDDADTNKNGLISVSEAYALVLHIYLKINRKAPIPPPSRSKVEDLFNNADMDKNGQLKRDEFKRLMLILVSRASTRLLSYKLLTTVLAPLLASQIVHFLSGNVGALEGAANQLVSEKYLKIFMSDSVWLEGLVNEPLVLTVVTAFLVSKLGDKVLGASSSMVDTLIKRN